MSRQVWMDRTIEAARTADIKMPWSRSAKAEAAAAQAAAKAPVKIKAQA